MPRERNAMKTKPVVSISEDGTVTEYPSEKAAAEAIGVSRSQISVACNTTWRCCGMRWFRKGEEPIE